MPSLDSQETLEALTPEIIGQELCRAGVVDSPQRLHLEFIRRNPERRDYLTRAPLRVFVDGQPVFHLTIGHNLSDLRKRTQDFAEACPEIACRPLFWHQAGRWDYLGVEQFAGQNLETLVLSGRLTPQEAVGHGGRIVAALERTFHPSRIEAAAHEIDILFARVLASPVFGGFDRGFLREVVFPFIRDRALAGPFRTRWTNGDLVARNVLADQHGNVRLVDYEFAERSHFFAEDWWRWRSFSQLPPEALDLPALHATLPGGTWLEAFFILRQLVLAYESNCTHLVVKDSRAGFDRLVALAAAAHVGFRSSVFLQPLAGAATAPVGTSSTTGSARKIIAAQMSWSPGGNAPEEHTERLEYPVAQDTPLQFALRSIQGRVQLRFAPADSVGLLRISGLCLRATHGQSPLVILTTATGWDQLQLAGGFLRLVDSPELNLLILNQEACLLLPECDFGATPCDVVCEVRLRFTPELTALPNYLRLPFAAPTGSSTPAGSGPTLAEVPAHSRQVSAHATALEAELAERRQAFAALTAECAAARTGLAQAQENVKQTEQRAAALETETVRLRDDLKQREQIIARLEQAGRETTTKVRALDEALGALRRQYAVAGERLHTQDEAMRKLEHDSNSTQQELRQLHDRLEEAARRAENLRASLASAEKELADLRRRPLVRLDAALRRAKSKPAAPATQA